MSVTAVQSWALHQRSLLSRCQGFNSVPPGQARLEPANATFSGDRASAEEATPVRTDPKSNDRDLPGGGKLLHRNTDVLWAVTARMRREQRVHELSTAARAGFPGPGFGPLGAGAPMLPCSGSHGSHSSHGRVVPTPFPLPPPSGPVKGIRMKSETGFFRTGLVGGVDTLSRATVAGEPSPSATQPGGPGTALRDAGVSSHGATAAAARPGGGVSRAPLSSWHRSV